MSAEMGRGGEDAQRREGACLVSLQQQPEVSLKRTRLGVERQPSRAGAVVFCPVHCAAPPRRAVGIPAC